jgi:hypothetical protein
MSTALAFAMTAPAMAQDASTARSDANSQAATESSDAVGGGTAKALNSGVSNQTGNSTGLEHRSNKKRTLRHGTTEHITAKDNTAMNHSANTPNGSEKPTGTP